MRNWVYVPKIYLIVLATVYASLLLFNICKVYEIPYMNSSINGVNFYKVGILTCKVANLSLKSKEVIKFYMHIS